MKLAEFLLARIAEDERRWANPAFAPVTGVGLSELVLKMRAECEAKRFTIRRFQLLDDAPGPLSGNLAGQRHALSWALVDMASAYRDHEDWRRHDEWVWKS